MDEETITRAVGFAATDGELRLQAADWTGTLTLVRDGRAQRITVTAGAFAGPVTAGDAAPATTPTADDIVISGTAAAWEELLAPVPAPGFTDVFSAARAGRFDLAPVIGLARRHNAVRRFGELLRHARAGTDPTPSPRPVEPAHGRHDQAVGRYVHLDIGGLDHRVHYEEAGSGIPLLCAHTAGADGRQWRHLLEDERVTGRYRVIAYDMPFHGRSLPPAGTAWWTREYRLTTESAMAVPLALGDALGLAAPVFMGSSIGGMLALDLARHHPERFRAVISLQGGLRSSGGLTPEGAARIERFRTLERLADPALHAARQMAMMSPTAPQEFRQETMLGYAQGAPGVFAGDLYFHAVDHDLRDEAQLIDTTRCAVHLLTGEYDPTMVPISQRAAAAIPGARLQIMKGLGHFPMSEDHDALMPYLLPVLDEIAVAGAP